MMTNEGFTRTDLYAILIFHAFLAAWTYRLIGVAYYTTDALNDCTEMSARLNLLRNEERAELFRRTLKRMATVFLGFMIVSLTLAISTYYLMKKSDGFKVKII